MKRRSKSVLHLTYSQNFQKGPRLTIFELIIFELIIFELIIFELIIFEFRTIGQNAPPPEPIVPKIPYFAQNPFPNSKNSTEISKKNFFCSFFLPPTIFYP